MGIPAGKPEFPPPPPPKGTTPTPLHNLKYFRWGADEGSFASEGKPIVIHFYPFRVFRAKRYCFDQAGKILLRVAREEVEKTINYNFSVCRLATAMPTSITLCFACVYPELGATIEMYCGHLRNVFIVS